MPSFWKIIDSWFGASSESGSHTAPLANPPNPPAPPSPLIFTRKNWYEQKRHNPRHNLPSSLPSASVAMNQEKNQKQTIDTTIPTLDAGAKGVMQDYLKSRKRTRKDQHTIMPKEKTSLAYKGIHFKQAEPDRIIIHKFDDKCTIKGKVQVGAQLKGIDGNTSFSTLKEVDNLLSTIKINANHDLKFEDVIDIDSSTDENSVIDLSSTTDDES